MELRLLFATLLGAILAACLATMANANTEQGEEAAATPNSKEMSEEEFFGSIVLQLLKIGGTFTFPKYKGLSVGIEPNKLVGPEKDPDYAAKKWGVGEGGELEADSLIVLNEDNFEHLTQAASGMTTGHWFVMFGSPWCEHCTNMMAHWNRTARELKQEVNVAWIDASTAPFTSQRFNITAYPTILALKRGKYWTYDVNREPRKWKELMTYARLVGEEGWDETDAGKEIPPVHDSWTQYWNYFWAYFARLWAFAQKKPWLSVGIVLCSSLFGAVLPLYYILSAPMDPAFPGIMLPKEKFTGPKVWDASKSSSSSSSEQQPPTQQDDKKREDEQPHAPTSTVAPAASASKAGLTNPQKRKSGGGGKRASNKS